MSNLRVIKTEDSENPQIAMYNEEPGTMTPEEAVAHWKACAWLRIPCRMWNSGTRVKMTDKIARSVRTEELTSDDRRVIAQLLCHNADARSWTLLDGFDFIKVSVDYGKPHDVEPGLMVDAIAVTPEVVTAFGRVAARWHVQSVDIDDRQDECLSLDEALIRAATRAVERKIRERARAN